MLWRQRGRRRSCSSVSWTWQPALSQQERLSWGLTLNAAIATWHTICCPALSSDTHASMECHAACAHRCYSLLSCPPPHRRSSSTWTTLRCNTAVGHRTHRPPASRAGMQRPRLLPPARLNNRPSSHRRSRRRQATGRRALVLHMAHTVHRQAARRSSNPHRSSSQQATGSRALVLPMVGPQVSVPPSESFAEPPQVMHARPLVGQMANIATLLFPTTRQLEQGMAWAIQCFVRDIASLCYGVPQLNRPSHAADSC